MPSGTSAIEYLTTPSERWVADPGQFFALTEKKEVPIATVTQPALGQPFRVNLPNSGIVSRIAITYQGTLTVASGGGVVTSDRWPYGLLDNVQVIVNGSTTTWNVTGEDLHVRRFVRFPAYDEQVDFFTGTVGGGDTLAAGTYPMYTTWEIDLAADDSNLAGSYFMQSGAVSVAVIPQLATASQLFTAQAARASFAGTFTVEETQFMVPRSQAEGNPLVTPDLSVIHKVLQYPMQFTSGGEWRVTLPRDTSRLIRLFADYASDTATPLSALPDTADAHRLDAIRLQYGTDHVLYNYVPAARLLSRNNDWYNAPAPYDRLVFDQIRENGPRDVINQAGVTELAVIATPNSSVTVGAGEARIVTETIVG